MLAVVFLDVVHRLMEVGPSGKTGEECRVTQSIRE